MTTLLRRPLHFGLLVVFAAVLLVGYNVMYEEADRSFVGAVQACWSKHHLDHPGALTRDMTVLLLSFHREWPAGDDRLYFEYAGLMLGRGFDRAFMIDRWSSLTGLERVMWPPESATGPLVPYRDFAMEYPPGCVPWMVAPRFFADTPEEYRVWFALEMGLVGLAALLLAVGIAARGGDARVRRVLVGSVLALLALGPIVTSRLDVLVGLLVVASVGAALAGRGAWAGALLAAAAGCKLVPVLLLPVLCLSFVRASLRGQAVRCAVACGVVLALQFVPPALAGQDRFWASLRFHADRTIQIESTWGTAMLLHREVAAEAVRLVKDHGSVNLTSSYEAVLNAASPLATLLLVALIALLYARHGSREDLPRAVLATLAAVLLTAKVLSPQYLVWLVPLAFLVEGRDRLAIDALVVATLLATQMVFPVFYEALKAFNPAALALLVVRNGLLAALLGVLVAPWVAAMRSGSAHRQPVPPRHQHHEGAAHGRDVVVGA